MIPVVWTSNVAGEMGRGFWDEGILEATFDRSLWHPANALRFQHYDDFTGVTGTAVVIVHVSQTDGTSAYIQQSIRRLDGVLLIVCGDEEHRFPTWSLMHPNMAVWQQLPTVNERAGHQPARYLGEGWPSRTPSALTLARVRDAARLKTLGWFFAGQVTHTRREQCIAALAELPGGELVETSGFTKGLVPGTYYESLASARIAPCPSGPVNVDTFRLWEALEADCIPIADGSSPVDDHDHTRYWDKVAPGHPFPIIADWNEIGPLREQLLADWPRDANRIGAWWGQYKRHLAVALDDDVRSLLPAEHSELTSADGSSEITVIVTTSPIPSHPDTAMIDNVLASIRFHFPTVEIIVSCDGVRSELDHEAAAYHEYLRRLLARHHPNVVLLLHDEWVHQANLIRDALDLVRTPLVLMVEHDTPLVTDMDTDWGGLIDAIVEDEADMIRLHHEALVLAVHEHLMVDGVSWTTPQVPMRETIQWSQRPHLARTSYYRELIDEHFAPDCRTFVEDVMHSVCTTHDWEENRLWLYTPPGESILRSFHYDGRGDDPKAPVIP